MVVGSSVLYCSRSLRVGPSSSATERLRVTGGAHPGPVMFCSTNIGPPAPGSARWHRIGVESAQGSSSPLHPEQGRPGCHRGEQGGNPDRRGILLQREELAVRLSADVHGGDVPDSVNRRSSAVMVDGADPLKDVFSIGPGWLLSPGGRGLCLGFRTSKTTGQRSRSRLRLI